MLTSIGGRPSVAVLRSAALWTLTVNNDPWISAADMRTRKKQKLATEPHEPCTTSWTLDCPSNYFLRASVISYGFFMLSPNCLTPAETYSEPCTFKRHLQTAEEQAVLLTITQQSPSSRILQVSAADPVSTSTRAEVDKQIKRMLSLTARDQEIVRQFHGLHAEAAAASFGYMFRSPTLWEDLVKSITLCNCGWGRTLAMNSALCTQVGSGAFPSPAQVLRAGASTLQACGLGYRTKTLLRLAEQCNQDTLARLEALAETGSDEELRKALQGLAGMGPFTCTNIMQLLSRFDCIPCDSETQRHLKMYRGLAKTTAANLKQVAAETYLPWHPFQFLAYWFELCKFYQGIYGLFYTLAPAHYHKFSGAHLRKAAKQQPPPEQSPA